MKLTFYSECIFKQCALWEKSTCGYKKQKKCHHWLEHANDSYPPCIIDDTKKTLRMLCLNIPLAMFWSLFDQQVNKLCFIIVSHKCLLSITMHRPLPWGFNTHPNTFLEYAPRVRR